MAGKGNVHKRVLLISGTQRSGTSAMADLLMAHSEMIITNERYIKLAKKERYETISYDSFSCERLLFPKSDETQNFQWGEFDYAHQQLIAKYDRAKVVGDKVPLYHYFLDHLFSEMGKSKLIFMARNVYDVASSWQARAEDPGDKVWNADFRGAIEWWNRDNARILEEMRKYKSRIRVVSYERLFSYSPNYLAKVLDYIGVNPKDEAILLAYGEMTRDWMRRFSKPPRLTPARLETVAKTADVSLYQQVIDAGEI